MSIAPRARLATHEVFNQPLPRERLELWSADAPLQAAVAEAAPGDAEALAAFAAEIGSPQALDDAERAQRVKPELVVFDRGGRRLDEVRFHPGYHAMMARGAQAGYFARPWAPARPRARTPTPYSHSTPSTTSSSIRRVSHRPPPGRRKPSSIASTASGLASRPSTSSRLRPPARRASPIASHTASSVSPGASSAASTSAPSIPLAASPRARP